MKNAIKKLDVCCWHCGERNCCCSSVVVSFPCERQECGVATFLCWFGETNKEKSLLDRYASFGHATFGTKFGKRIRNLEFLRAGS